MFERLQEPVAEARHILQTALTTYYPKRMYALFSGGHDSLCAAHVASSLSGFAGCVHIHTGIGIPETREYVHNTCHHFGWPLLELSPPQSYEQLVSTYGFPGPPMHRVMYHALKERCLRQLMGMQKLGNRCRECGAASQGHSRINHVFDPECILLVSGVRQEESRRRMGHVIPINRDPNEKRRLWCAPIISWTTSNKNAYIAQHHLPTNPVVGKLCMSGECLCGAYAAENEIQEIERWYPLVAARIHAIEDDISLLGKPCVWGQRHGPISEPDEQQGSLFGLCWSCSNKTTTYEEAS